MPRYRPNEKAFSRGGRKSGGGQAMMGRALLAIAIAGMTLHHAAAQFGGMPGMPGASPPGEGLGTPQQGPPPQCRGLLAIRDELQKQGQAIEAANTKRADVKVACGLFRKYIATEAKMLKMLEADGASCGAPPHVLQQVRGSHAKSQQIGKQVCDAARGVPGIRDDRLIPPKPMPRREPWPTRVSGLS
jgi:hypothetical protein